MANQLHIAHSADIMGAAMIAGGLYGCAVQDVESDGVLALASQAVGPCMKAPFMLDDVSTYKDRLEKLAAKGWIDPPANLARAKIYFFTGGSDDVVPSETVEKGKALYDALGVPAGNIVFEDRSGPAAKAGHSWVTKNFGGSCYANASPYIDDCHLRSGRRRTEGDLRRRISSRPPPRRPAASSPSTRRNSSPARRRRRTASSDTGYLYVPKACEPGAAQPCRLQVALHGCKQSAEVLGDVFYTKIGVNEWADANRILVLYPQAHATTLAELPRQLWLTGAPERQPERLLELVGLRRRPPISDEEGRAGQRDLEDDRAARGEVGPYRLPTFYACRLARGKRRAGGASGREISLHSAVQQILFP